MKIRFSTDILRRLGEELNPSVDKGILELVKNAYDADATYCTVEIVNAEQVGGSISVRDNGDGMTAREIEDGWLVLGRSPKSQQTRTRLNRIPAGSKGLGRMAALRLGTRALLTTRPQKQKNTEYNLLIDWDAYKNVELVDDVELEIEKSTKTGHQKTGTEIRIENLHSRIGRREVKRLARELLLLAGPFGDDPTGFKPSLKAPEFRDLEAIVRNRYFQDADYHLTAFADKEGRVEAKVLDWKGAVLYGAKHEDISSGQGHPPYVCPELSFELWVYLLGKSSFQTRSASISEVRGWLQEFGGVHIYQNGLRVPPYGDPGNDWLDMNLSRVRSPEERPSTNTSIGRVLFDDSNVRLIQKTDRSGFIETDTFVEIRRFAKDALDWMANRRLEEAEKRRAMARIEAPRGTDESKKQLDAAVEKLPKSARTPIKKAVDQAWHSVNKEIGEYQREVQLYRTLSTAGITSATFAHESAGNPIKVIDQSILAIERRAKKHCGEVYEQQLKQPVQGIIKAIRGLSVLGNATLKLLDHEKRRPARVDIHGVIDNVLETFEPFFTGRDIKVIKNLCPGSPFLRGSEAAIESIVTNLINNSVAAFERSESKDRQMQIQTIFMDSILRLRVADNGPGILGINVRDIWLPGRTTRKNGTGLGLTIVRDTVKDLGGDVEAEANCELGGAEVLIDLPILGV